MGSAPSSRGASSARHRPHPAGEGRQVGGPERRGLSAAHHPEIGLHLHHGGVELLHVVAPCPGVAALLQWQADPVDLDPGYFHGEFLHDHHPTSINPASGANPGGLRGPDPRRRAGPEGASGTRPWRPVGCGAHPDGRRRPGRRRGGRGASATPKVTRKPAATASGRAAAGSAAARREGEHRAHEGRAGDEPEVARQAEQAGDDAPLVRVGAEHDGGAVGGLEQLVSGRQDQDGAQVAHDPEPGREAAARAAAPAAIRPSPARVTGASPRDRSTARPARTPQRVERSGPTAITSPTRAGWSPRARAEIERADHQGRHHDRGNEQVHGETGPQGRLPEPRHRQQGGGRPGLPAQEQGPAEDGQRHQGGPERTRNGRGRGSWPARRRPRCQDQQQGAGAVESAGPGRGCWSGRLGRWRRTRTRFRSPSGTLTRKIERQPEPAIRACRPWTDRAGCRWRTWCRAGPWRGRSAILGDGRA